MRNMVIPFNQARYCPECDVIFLNDMNICPCCCNKNSTTMSCIRNAAVTKLGNLKERREIVRSDNFNQIKLFEGNKNAT